VPACRSAKYDRAAYVWAGTGTLGFSNLMSKTLRRREDNHGKRGNDDWGLPMWRTSL
jgi:hypothetical protein